MSPFFNRFKVLVVFALLLTTASSLEAQLNGINCFVYHRFGDDRYPSTNIDTEVFEQHLKYLKENDYNVITFGEAAGLIESEKVIPSKTAVITIDDGYETVFTNGFPLLKEYGFPATVFISTKQIGYGDQMNWEQIRTMQEEGIEIGMHSHSHDFFLDLPPDKRIPAFNQDVEKCIAEFRNNLDTVPIIYAYPFGEFSAGMIDVLKKYGVVAAAGQFSGVMSRYADTYSLPRFPMNESFGSLESFKEKLKMKPMPVLKEMPEALTQGSDLVPMLHLRIDTSLVNPEKINCYWYGSKNCKVEIQGNGKVVISANSGLQGRRGKYTLTAPLKNGDWCWYSYPWFNAEQ